LERTLLHQRILYHWQQREQSQTRARTNIRAKTQKERRRAASFEEIIESSKPPPAEQALLPNKRLTTTAARPKKGRKKKKGGGMEPILEHHDAQYDPYYMKHPLPTHIK